MPKFGALFRKKKIERELDEELRFHLEKQIEQNVARGMSAEEARYAALRQFGNLEQTKEECREAWGVRVLEEFVQDIRFGLRQLRRSPGFTIVAVLTLALGIGANTAIFSLAYSVMLESLPVNDPQRLVVMKAVFPKWPEGYSINGSGKFSLTGTSTSDTFSYLAFKAMSGERQALVSVFGFAPPEIGNDNLALDIDGQARAANGVMVTGNYFLGLGVSAVLGRVIAPPDENPGASRVADISFGYWAGAFGHSPAVVGRSITINRTPFTIVGVLPPDFSGTEPGKSPDIWIPITANAKLAPWGGMPASQVFGSGTVAWMTIMGRLQPGVNGGQAASAVSLAFQRNLEASLGHHFRPDEIPRVELLAGGRGLDSLRESLSRPLLVLIALAGFLLLLACANLAALLLARGAARQGEIALRAALGASRSRLVRQVLTEGIVLGLLGGTAALAVAKWGSDALVLLFSAGRQQAAGMSSPGLLFLAVASLVAGVLVGIVPAFRGTAAAPIRALKAADTPGSGRKSARWPGWSNGLVVAQVALSIMLLAAAGLFLRTLRNAEAEKTGINPGHVLLFGINPIGYNGRQAQALYERLLEHFRALPGVESATVSRFTIFSGWGSTGDIEIIGYHPRPGQNMMVDSLPVGTGFFRTMGIALLAGRSIEDRDLGPPPKAAVVNEAFAQRFFGHASPIGQTLEWGSAQVPIVGVVADAKFRSPLKEAPAMVYWPTSDGYFEVRAHGDPLALVPTIRRVVEVMAPGVPLTGVETQTHQINECFMQQRLLASLGGFFGLLGLLLAALGAYGLMSFRITQRTHEIGIRMALGAQKSDVLKMVIRQGLKLALIGVAIGIAGALILTRFLASLLYGVKPTDPLTFVAVSLLLIAVALLACYIPARRAAKVDPMVALRYE